MILFQFVQEKVTKVTSYALFMDVIFEDCRARFVQSDLSSQAKKTQAIHVKS